MSKQAIYVRTLESTQARVAKLYAVSHGFLRVSALRNRPEDEATPETYIFACNQDGEVLDWSEQDGGYVGGFDHEEALRRGGYEVVCS